MFGAEPGGDAAFLPAEAARGGSTELSRSDFKPNFMGFFRSLRRKVSQVWILQPTAAMTLHPVVCASGLFMSLFIIVQSKSNFVNESLNGLSDFINSENRRKVAEKSFVTLQQSAMALRNSRGSSPLC